MTDKERKKEMMRRKKTLDIAYGIYKTDGPGVLTPKMQEVMDKYINLEIDYEEYLLLQVINSNDPYLKCSNKQEQEKIAELSLRMEPEPRYMTVERKNKRQNIEFKLKKQKYIEDLDDDYEEYLIGGMYEQFAY